MSRTSLQESKSNAETGKHLFRGGVSGGASNAGDYAKIWVVAMLTNVSRGGKGTGCIVLSRD
jgi:hypothetical protein